MPSLGNDLAQIRKAKELSLDDIHEATKIPNHILRSIEDDSIFSDFEENATYIRSYVRSYAKALSIDEQKIVYALDKRQKGNYQGSLMQILEEGDSEDWEDTGAFDFEDEEKSHPISEKEDKTKDEGEEAIEGEASEQEPLKPEADNDSATDENDEEQEEEEFRHLPSNTGTGSPNVRSIDWANVGRRFQPLESTKSKVWIGIVTIIIIIAAGSYIFFYETDATEPGTEIQNSQEQQSGGSDVASDSLQLNIIPPASEDSSELRADTETVNLNNRSIEALPDTLNLVVYAAYGKLEPVRIYTDIMGNINPYWVEQGEALRFNFVNEIRIRGQYNNLVLLLNGHVIQNIREQFYNPDTRLLEINRSYFEGDSRWLQPAPDSLQIDGPAPSVIRNRPTFN